MKGGQTMRKIGAFGVLIGMCFFVLVHSLTPCEAIAQQTDHERVRVPVLTLPLGAGIYEWWASYERIFEANHPWLRVAAQETPGFIYNLKEMANNKKRWETCIFGTDRATQVAAENAIKPFFDKPIDVKPFKYLYPFNGCAKSTWLWVTLDPKIKSMMDFEGKRLGIGFRGQIAWGLRPTAALEALGVKAKLEYLGPLPSVEALLDGRVDAAQVSTYVEVKAPGVDLPARPLATLQQLLASRRQFFYVSYDNNWIERMKDQKGYTIANATEINAGVLPKQDKRLVGIQCSPDGWAVHEAFPEDIAYEFTKFMIKHGQKLEKYSKVGEYFFIPKGFLHDFGFTEENVHPGAIRAYKEAGIWN
jgi:TRAP-type uncharacterized transport system substrate-binding protein